jgi:hypothetical protein
LTLTWSLTLTATATWPLTTHCSTRAKAARVARLRANGQNEVSAARTIGFDDDLFTATSHVAVAVHVNDQVTTTSTSTGDVNVSTPR